MILRRIAEHVKAQNWFAVFIDFVIVVVGVFIGLQVQEWSQRRAMEDRATVLMERLESDFGVDVWVALTLHEYHEQVQRHALLTLNDITGRQDLSDEALLIAAHRASQFNRFNRTSAIYEELVATGGFELIFSSEIGSTAALFYRTTILDDYEQDGKSSDYRRLYRRLIPIDVQLAVSEQCGDRGLTIEELLNEESAIGYPCTLDLPSGRLAEAAAILRQEPELALALRHRIATLATQNRDFGIIIDAIRPYRAGRETLEESSIDAVFRARE